MHGSYSDRKSARSVKFGIVWSLDVSHRSFELRVGPYRFFFYAGDREEPPHIHVERDENEAKFWLAPPQLERNKGFPRHEINKIERLIEEHQEFLMECWDEYFDQ